MCLCKCSFMQHCALLEFARSQYSKFMVCQFLAKNFHQLMPRGLDPITTATWQQWPVYVSPVRDRASKAAGERWCNESRNWRRHIIKRKCKPEYKNRRDHMMLHEAKLAIWNFIQSIPLLDFSSDENIWGKCACCRPKFSLAILHAAQCVHDSSAAGAGEVVQDDDKLFSIYLSRKCSNSQHSSCIKNLFNPKSWFLY